MGEGEAVAPGSEVCGGLGHLGEGRRQGGAGGLHHRRIGGVGLFGDSDADGAAVAPGAGEACEGRGVGAGVLDQVVEPLESGVACGDTYGVLVLGQVQVGGVAGEEPGGARGGVGHEAFQVRGGQAAAGWRGEGQCCDVGVGFREFGQFGVLSGPVGVRGGGRDAGRRGWGGGLLRCRTECAQPGQDLLATAAPQREEHERVGVDGGGDGVAERGRVLARVTPVGAGALRIELGGQREQRDPCVLCVVDEFGGHLAVEKCREMSGAGRDRVEPGVPLGVGEDGQMDRGAVRVRAAALDSGLDLARGDGDRSDHAFAGVGASAREASGVQGGVLQVGHPCLASLGAGTFASRNVPAPVAGLTGVTKIAAGCNHNLALVGPPSGGTGPTSGTAVKAWGYNATGQLGDNSTVNRYTPVNTHGNWTGGVSQIAAGCNHSIAVTGSKNELREWGQNTSRQLGDGTTDYRITPVTVPGLKGIQLVAGGREHTIALLGDNTVRSWGANGSGQLGNSTTTDSSTPVTTLTALTGVDKIAAPVGGDFSFAN
jgi:hypothetical protein